MKALRISTLVIVVLLVITAMLCILFGDFLALMSIACAYMLIYYLGVYVLIKFVPEEPKAILTAVVYILFALPLIWLLIDAEGLVNFLMQEVELDMK